MTAHDTATVGEVGFVGDGADDVIGGVPGVGLSLSSGADSCRRWPIAELSLARVVASGADGVLVALLGDGGDADSGSLSVGVSRAGCPLDALRVGVTVMVTPDPASAGRAIVVNVLGEVAVGTGVVGRGEIGGRGETGPIRVEVDGERRDVVAEEELVLRCGRSSIVLSKDGTIVIRGTKILSRAAGVNRIKGGAVEIN